MIITQIKSKNEYNFKDNPDKDFMKALVNYGLTGLPFKPVKVETISKRTPEEEGWQE